MPRYLDPKSDVVFKKIFGEHPHLLKSFLNALLPLSEDRQIVDLEYLPSEQIPAIPDFKRTIVDVKCRDSQGQIFIVEMQVEWGMSFMQRLLFGAAQAYVKQLRPGEHYRYLNPVYGLALVDSIFDEKTPDWYHHYGLVKLDNPAQEIINGLTLVFVELPKFKPTTRDDKRLKVLWLRFMRELNEQTKEAPGELLEVPEIKEAIKLAEQSAYSPGELEYYESYWKQVSSEKSLREDARAEGLAKGRAEGRAEGEQAALIEVAKKMKSQGLSLEIIANTTGLSLKQLQKL
ncbi:MAG: Rpn family recombination-promoting nuclease/putative transposase [Gammaproteobacteria bacterium]